VTQGQADRLEIRDFTSDVISTAVSFIYGCNPCKDPPKDDDWAHLVRVAQFGEEYEVIKLSSICFVAIYRSTNLFNVAEILVAVEGANFVNKKLRENLIRYVAM
jgi:hypothetical protein